MKKSRFPRPPPTYSPGSTFVHARCVHECLGQIDGGATAIGAVVFLQHLEHLSFLSLLLSNSLKPLLLVTVQVEETLVWHLVEATKELDSILMSGEISLAASCTFS